MIGKIYKIFYIIVKNRFIYSLLRKYQTVKSMPQRSYIYPQLPLTHPVDLWLVYFVGSLPCTINFYYTRSLASEAKGIKRVKR